MDKNSLYDTELLRAVECFKVCGYENFTHLYNFSEKDFQNIENYIRNYCDSLTIEERKMYMNETYARNSKNFTFSPLIKSNILKKCEKISGQIDLQRIMGTIEILPNISFTSDPINYCNENKQINESSDNAICYNINNEINQSMNSSFVNLTDKSSNSSENSEDGLEMLNDITLELDMDENMNALAKDKIHEYVVKYAYEKFQNCHLKTNEDFNVFIPNSNKLFGYFQCKICPKNADKFKTYKFNFTNYGSIIFGNIKIHLERHFTLQKDKVFQHGKRLIPLNLDGRNLVLCDKKYFEIVATLASEKFLSCHLKIDEDFLLYKDSEKTGYFHCKICPEKSQFKCKFSFSNYHSLIFTNIQSHLSSHFTSRQCNSIRGRKRKTTVDLIDEKKG